MMRSTVWWQQRTFLDVPQALGAPAYRFAHSRHADLYSRTLCDEPSRHAVGAAANRDVLRAVWVAANFD